MPETANQLVNNRLTIRVCKHSLSFSVIDKTSESLIRFEPYTVKSGVSIAANLREAFKSNELLQMGFRKALVMLNSPVLFVPVEEYKNEDAELLYKSSFHGHDNDLVLNNVLPDLNTVALFAINKDLKVVIDDHFEDVRYSTICQPVWNYLHIRSYTGVYQKVYGYFHDKKLEIFSFEKNRFKFVNTFDAVHAQDAAYFLLYTWKQLGMDAYKDELHIVGQIPEKEVLVVNLRKYIQKVYVLNPSAEFNRAPITQVRNLPFDLLTLYVKR